MGWGCRWSSKWKFHALHCQLPTSWSHSCSSKWLEVDWFWHCRYCRGWSWMSLCISRWNNLPGAEFPNEDSRNDLGMCRTQPENRELCISFINNYDLLVFWFTLIKDRFSILIIPLPNVLQSRDRGSWSNRHSISNSSPNLLNCRNSHTEQTIEHFHKNSKWNTKKKTSQLYSSHR